MPLQNDYEKAAALLRKSRRTVAFTGAGISVESGIPPFRGPDGLWSKIDPTFLDMTYFHSHAADSWKLIREIFYEFFGKARPNAAHLALAELEREGFLQAVITQNIDNLHQEAGNTDVIEFHGTAQTMVCQSCGASYPAGEVDLTRLPPKCGDCNGLLKPDFIFFGEAIPPEAMSRSLLEADQADVVLVIGTTGEIMPASMIPRMAKQQGASIIEINPNPSNYTESVTDVFLADKATVAAQKLLGALGLASPGHAG